MAARLSAAFLLSSALILSSLPLSHTQTFSACNPITQGNCPADPALGKSISIDFTSGKTDDFKASGPVSYNSDGMLLPVQKSGDSPTVTSNWYIMFGKVEVTMKAAAGKGIVSSVVLQSDDLDEIDWEWLGSDPVQVQSNYFGKGQTTTYNRGGFHANPNNQGQYITYSIDWSAGQVVWAIGGKTVRTLAPADAAGQYPQTPMQLKMGTWSGGDPANAPGTIQWAGGPTDYSACGNNACAMRVKSITVTDYSTGKSYSYSGTSGTWDSIKSDGGSVNSDGKNAAPVSAVSPSTVTSVSPSVPAFTGSDRGGNPSGVSVIVAGGGVGGSTRTTSAQSSASTPTNLPDGWTVNSSGKVVPAQSTGAGSSIVQDIPPSSSPPAPDSAATTPTAAPAAPAADPDPGAGTYATTKYDDRGFPYPLTLTSGQPLPSTKWDDRGFPITSVPPNTIAQAQVKAQINAGNATTTLADAVTTMTITSNSVFSTIVASTTSNGGNTNVPSSSASASSRPAGSSAGTIKPAAVLELLIVASATLGLLLLA